MIINRIVSIMYLQAIGLSERARITKEVFNFYCEYWRRDFEL
jgi:hypothetical protein